MGRQKKYQGYVTDLITDISLQWLNNRDPERPFFLMCHHKAPHRYWDSDSKHASLYSDNDIPEPVNLHDDYKYRTRAAEEAGIRIDSLTKRDLKEDIPGHLALREKRSWIYQRFIKEYLRVVASIDDNIGRMLDYIEEQGLKDNTIVIYTSDQGFFLGEHGWYDKRFMYEESIRMPFIIRYPAEIPAGSCCESLASNVDFAPTFLDYAGIPIPEDMHGRSLKLLLEGKIPADWRTSVYYHFWMNGAFKIPAHYGIRTVNYKLIHFYTSDINDWELFDLKKDPMEMFNVYRDSSYGPVIEQMEEELNQQRKYLCVPQVHMDPTCN